MILGEEAECPRASIGGAVGIFVLPGFLHTNPHPELANGFNGGIDAS